jgi:hypothetical protein
MKAICLNNHSHGIPANYTLDLPLDIAIAGINRLFFDRNRVDVGSIRGKWHIGAMLFGAGMQGGEDLNDAIFSLIFQHPIQGFEPFDDFKSIFRQM